MVAFLRKLVVLLVSEEMPDEKKPASESKRPSPGKKRGKIKLEAYGEEMVDKVIGLSGKSGRVYLPPDWVGCRVKIIRLD
jgi:putative transposon-encoded protein